MNRLRLWRFCLVGLLCVSACGTKVYLNHRHTLTAASGSPDQPQLGGRRALRLLAGEEGTPSGQHHKQYPFRSKHLVTVSKPGQIVPVNATGEAERTLVRAYAALAAAIGGSGPVEKALGSALLPR